MSESDDDILQSDHEEEIQPKGRRPSVGHSDDESTVSTTISEHSDVKKEEVSKRDPTKPKRKTRKARSLLRMQLGHMYRLKDGREGECKFFGETQFADGDWVGLQLEPEWEGKHDGTVKDKRYFKCLKGQGCFVKHKFVVEEIKIKKRNKRISGLKANYVVPKYEPLKKIVEPAEPMARIRQLGPRDYGRNKDYKVAKYEQPEVKRKEPEMPTIRKPGPRDFKRDKDYKIYKAPKIEAKKTMPIVKRQRSLGPRDMGRNLDYVMPKWNNKPVKKEERVKVPKKLGPREIGRSDYKPPKFTDTKKSKTSTKERKPSKSSRKKDEYVLPKFKTVGGKAPKKLGPRDVDRSNKGYKAPKYDIEETWKVQPKEDPGPLEKKAGPRETGRLKGWKSADYGIDLKKLQTEDFTKERHTVREKQGEVEKKLGPRDIGRNKYKAAKYDIKDSGEFLSQRISSTSKPAGKVEKKLGPRDIGRNKYKAAKYDIKDSGEFLSERNSSTSSKPAGKVEKKLGPRDIGRNKDYDAAKFTSSKKSKPEEKPKRKKTLEYTKPKFTRKYKKVPAKKDEDDSSSDDDLLEPPTKPELTKEASKGDPTKSKGDPTSSQPEVTEDAATAESTRTNVKPENSKPENPWQDVLKPTKKLKFSKAYYSNKSIAEIMYDQNATVDVVEEEKEEESTEVDAKEEEATQEEEIEAKEEPKAPSESSSEDDLMEPEVEEQKEETPSPAAASKPTPPTKSENVNPKPSQKIEEKKPAPSNDIKFCRGLYTVMKATWLREDVDTSSRKVRKVNQSEFVNITKVVKSANGLRIRGKVGTDGFMTLRNNENGMVFVRLIRQMQDEQEESETISDEVEETVEAKEEPVKVIEEPVEGKEIKSEPVKEAEADEDSSVEITESDDDEDKVERPAIMADWENDHVLSWVETMPSLRQYAEDFEIGEVDGDDLISYTDDDLQSLGIESSVHRKLLLSAVKKYLDS